MIFTAPIDFDAALQAHAVKTILPTTLNSVQYRALGAAIKQRALFSATVSNAEILDQLDRCVTALLSGTSGLAKQREVLGALIHQFNGDREVFDSGRLNLMLSTNAEIAAGYGQFIQANDPDALAAFPAQELFRLEDRQEPRDWDARWQEAAAAAGDGDAARVAHDNGVWIARLDSDIWENLGNLWDDSLGNEFPPYAFKSGMWTRPVSRAQAEELGLLESGAKVQPAAIPDFNATLKQSFAMQNAALQKAVLDQLGDFVKFQDGVLTLK